jgi:hypothetical protein
MCSGRKKSVFGGQCIKNPFYKPGKPTVSGGKSTVSQSTRSWQSFRAIHSTCTAIKSLCFSQWAVGADPVANDRR